MRKLKPGTVVQVKEEATKGGWEYVGYNRSSVEKHGWLWIIAKYIESDGEGGHIYWCKSIATGWEARFLSSELNTHNKTKGAN